VQGRGTSLPGRPCRTHGDDTSVERCSLLAYATWLPNAVQRAQCARANPAGTWPELCGQRDSNRLSEETNTAMDATRFRSTKRFPRDERVFPGSDEGSIADVVMHG